MWISDSCNDIAVGCDLLQPQILNTAAWEPPMWWLIAKPTALALGLRAQSCSAARCPTAQY